jgi:tetratricopeptide (TPR) repeat protein
MWYGQAARDFTAAIEAAPTLIKAYAQRAICFAALGEASKAAEDNARVRELEAAGSPDQQPDRPSAQASYQRARQAMEGGGLISDSLYFLQKAIDADPGFADAYDARSDVYFNLGMADESMADIQRVGKLKTKRSGVAAPARARTVLDQQAPRSTSTGTVSKPWWKIW